MASSSSDSIGAELLEGDGAELLEGDLFFFALDDHKLVSLVTEYLADSSDQGDLDPEDLDPEAKKIINDFNFVEAVHGKAGDCNKDEVGMKKPTPLMEAETFPWQQQSKQIADRIESMIEKSPPLPQSKIRFKVSEKVKNLEKRKKVKSEVRNFLHDGIDPAYPRFSDGSIRLHSTRGLAKHPGVEEGARNLYVTHMKWNISKTNLNMNFTNRPENKGQNNKGFASVWTND